MRNSTRLVSAFCMKTCQIEPSKSNRDTLILGAAQDRQVYEWNDAAGSVDFKHKICTSPAPMTLSDFLETFNDNAPRKSFIVLKDVQHYFERESKYYDAKAIAGGLGASPQYNRTSRLRAG